MSNDQNINKPILPEDHEVNEAAKEKVNTQKSESLLEIQNKVKANLIETLGGVGNSYTQELQNLIGQEKNLIDKITPHFSQLSQEEQDQFFQDLTTPIVLPSSIQANDELMSNLGEIIKVRSKFEAELDKMLETINQAAKRLNLQDFKKRQLSQLATTFNFELEEGLILQSNEFNIDFQILDIAATHQEIKLEDQEKLEFKLGEIKFPQVIFTINKSSDNEDGQKLTYNLSEFKNLIEEYKLEPKIENLSDLERLIGFHKYGQTLTENTFVQGLDSEDNKVDLQILNIDEQNQNITLSQAVKINGKDTSVLNYRQFIKFYKHYRVEQKFNLNEAKEFVQRLVKMRKNTSQKMDEFELKNGDILEIGTDFYLLNNLTENDFYLNKIEGPYQVENPKASEQFQYSRLIYHLKHSDVIFHRNYEDDQSDGGVPEEVAESSKTPVDEISANDNKYLGKNAFLEINWNEVYNSMQTPTEFIADFFSQFNFVSLKSYSEAIKTVKESITNRMDRAQTLKTNELLTKIGNSRIKSGAERKIAADISEGASKYKEEYENTYDIEKFFETLYAPGFGNRDAEDKFKFKAIIDILAQKGLMRFESQKLAIAINHLLDNFNAQEFKGVLNKKDNTYQSPNGELKGQSWAIWALGKVYGSSTANSWESQNSSAYNSSRNEGSAVVGRKINSGEDSLKDLHKYLVKINNDDYEDVPVPAYLMGMIDSLFGNKMIPVELKIFYFLAFTGIEYYGEPILPKDYFATTEDYGKVGYILHFFSANQINSGDLQDTKKMKKLLDEFKFQFETEIKNPLNRLDYRKFRSFLFENLSISQRPGEDSADQNIVQDGSVSKAAPNELHFLAPRYSKEVIEKQVIGVESQYANPQPKINQQKIIFGYSQGFRSAIEKANADSDNEEVVRYAFKKMVPGYFALSTYVSGINYLTRGRSGEFDESDFKYTDNMIDKDTPLSHHIGACNDYLKNILTYYKDKNLVLPINGQMRPIKQKDIDIWLDREQSKQHASQSKENHDSFMKSFFTVFDRISDQDDFVEAAIRVPNKLGYVNLPNI